MPLTRTNSLDMDHNELRSETGLLDSNQNEELSLTQKDVENDAHLQNDQILPSHSTLYDTTSLPEKEANTNIHISSTVDSENYRGPSRYSRTMFIPSENTKVTPRTRRQRSSASECLHYSEEEKENMLGHGNRNRRFFGKQSSVTEKKVEAMRKRRKNILVMDSARSWVICLANFILLLNTSAFGRAISMNFPDFVQRYETTITTASLSFTFHLISISLSSVLGTSLLIPFTGERASCVIGCVLSSISTIGIVLSHNIGLFIFFMSIKGVAVGITIIPAISMIPKYFLKRRSLAVVLAHCGLSLGAMAAPPLLELLAEEYGVQGSLLILAGTEMHSIAAMMLLRPLNTYDAVVTKQEDDVDDGKDDECNDEEESENMTYKMPDPRKSNVTIEYSSVSDTEQKKSFLAGPVSTENSIQVCTASVSLSPHSVRENGAKEGGCEGSSTISVEPNDNDQFLTETLKNDATVTIQVEDEEEKRCSQIKSTEEQEILLSKRLESNRCKPTDTYNSSNDFQAKNSGQPFRFISKTASHVVSEFQKVEEMQESRSNDNLPKHNTRYLSRSSVIHPKLLLHSKSGEYSSQESEINGHAHLYVKSHGHKSSLTRLQVDHFRSRTSITTSDSGFRQSSWSIMALPDQSSVCVDALVLSSNFTLNNVHENTSCMSDDGRASVNDEENLCLKAKESLLRVFNVRLLKSWALRFLFMSSVFGILVGYEVAYLPTLAVKEGLNADQISTMLTVSGALDLVSRVALGVFTDMHILKPTTIVAITQVCIGTVCFFGRFYTNFKLLIFLSVASGLFAGCRQSLGTLLTLQFMGDALFLKALGFQTMFGTLSLAAHHPLLSSIVEGTGSFEASFQYVGVALYLSSLLLVMEPFSKKLDVKYKTLENID